jgi:hypothetical protein
MYEIPVLPIDKVGFVVLHNPVPEGQSAQIIVV